LNGAAGEHSEPGVPYPIFSYAGLLVWQYFSEGVNRASKSLVTNSVLVSKVYFPRLVAPLSGVLAPLVDFAIAFVILIGLMAYYGTSVSWNLLLVVPFLLIAILCASAFGILLAALNVEYRDVGYAVPISLQLWMFLTPVVYPAEHVHGALRVIYALNPMATVVAGFRWAILGSSAPDWDLALPSMLVLALVFFGGVMYFRRTERTFADAI
jgi:lipopolysaccharide transport system permease protein